MSVIYNGREHKVKFNGFLFTLDLSFRGIEDIFEIKGLEKLTSLHVLDLSNNNIFEIKGFETLINLKKLYIGNNPIYRNLKNANKKKLSEITGLKQPLEIGKNPKAEKIRSKLTFGPRTSGEACCGWIKCLTVFVFLLASVPKIGL